VQLDKSRVEKECTSEYTHRCALYFLALLARSVTRDQQGFVISEIAAKPANSPALNWRRPLLISSPTSIHYAA